MKRSATILSAVIALVFAQSAFATADPPTKSTQERIDALQKELDALKEEQLKAKLQSQEQPRTTFNNNRLSIASADGRTSISFRALVQADAGYYDQDQEGLLSTDFRRGSVGAAANRENNAARDLSSGMYFRRARLGVEGQMNRDFTYKLILELGGSGTELQGRINDAYIAYTGFAPFTFQIGAFSPPSNLDDGTPADDTLFLERAAPNELSRALGGADGRIGLGMRGNGQRWMSALTYTGRTVADPEVFDAQKALVGRFAYLAMTANDYNLHLGASGTYVLSPAEQGIDSTGARIGVRFRDRPELRVDSARLIDTGVVDAEHAYVVSADLAANWRNWYFQGEHYWYGIDRLIAVDDSKFNGYYAQSSWVFTGESHRYNMANGAYQAPRPFQPFSSGGGMGAWELAVRFSHIDLNFASGTLGTAPTASAVRGGVQDIWTLGVNWYATTNVKFMLNYLIVDVDRLNPAGPGNAIPFGAAPATPPVGVQIGQKLNAVALRSQFNF